MPRNWPRLSESLGERHPLICQLCGRPAEVRWREHDDNDRPTSTVLMLCSACSDSVIDPHPRLYSRTDRWQPMPGSMECCDKCRHRSGLDCQSPLLKALGGPGLPIRHAKPRVIHIDYMDKQGRRRGDWLEAWDAPPVCDGKEIQ